MIQEYQLRLLPEIAANEQRLKEYLSKEKGLSLKNITAIRILKRSIDARQRTIFINLKVRAYINEMPADDEYERTVYSNVEGKPQVIVVGAGPGGLFAALKLIESGLRPIVVAVSYTHLAVHYAPCGRVYPYKAFLHIAGASCLPMT